MALRLVLPSMKKKFMNVSGVLSIQVAGDHDKYPPKVWHKFPPCVPPVNPPPNDHLPFKVYTLDDLPVPQGSWQEDYDRRNRKYWQHLIFGIAFFLCPVTYMIVYQPVFFNAFAPPMPPKEERIKSFWDPRDDDE